MIIPANNYVLCKLTNEKKHLSTINNFIFEKEEMPIYEILKIGTSKDFQEKNISVGDLIIINSTGTLVIENDISYYLVNIENIAAKIEKD